MPNDMTIKRGRTEAEIEQDLALVAQLYVRGMSQRDIAELIEQQYSGEVSVTIANIRNDIITIRKEWVNSALIDFNERRAEELAHLDQLEAAYWKAWEDSCSPKTITEHVEGLSQAISGGRAIDLENNSTKEIIEQRDGNPLYLQGIERCIEKRCKILGLFSPETFRVDWRSNIAKLGWKPEEAERLKEDTVKSIMELLQRAADDERLQSGNIAEAEFHDEEL